MNIHPTAIVSDKANLHESIDVGPYCIIGDGVTVGANTSIGAHTVIDGCTTIGSGCKISPHCGIGLPPQDIAYADEVTKVIIGNNVTIREFCTIHRGTVKGGGETIVGDEGFFMSYVHIGHDCKVGNKVIFANGVTLGGHVVVHDGANISALFLAHQFIEIGKLTMVSGLSGSRKSIPPFVLAEGRPSRIMRVNTVGLQRAGFSKELIKAISEAYQLIKRKETKTALAEIEALSEKFPELKDITDFYHRILDSSRGVTSFYSAEREFKSNGLTASF